MKKLIQNSWTAAALVAVFFVLSSFRMPGVHTFQVYMDSKLIADQYVYTTRELSIPKLTLDHATSITIKYSECNKTVTGRTLTIKDEQDKVLKEWHFDGTTSGYKDPMTIKVSDVIALRPKATLKLIYSSEEFTAGQQVASIVTGKDA
ncbi:MAG: hypothetical protein WDO14_14110 [Bacteroidota bacterium]